MLAKVSQWMGDYYVSRLLRTSEKNKLLVSIKNTLVSFYSDL